MEATIYRPVMEQTWNNNFRIIHPWVTEKEFSVINNGLLMMGFYNFSSFWFFLEKVLLKLNLPVATNFDQHNTWKLSRTIQATFRSSLLSNISVVFTITFSFPFNFRDRLTEINMDSSVIYKYIIHLKICTLTVLFLKIYDKNYFEMMNFSFYIPF